MGFPGLFYSISWDVGHGNGYVYTTHQSRVVGLERKALFAISRAYPLSPAARLFIVRDQKPLIIQPTDTEK